MYKQTGLMLSFILSIYILQSSRDKLARYIVFSHRHLKAHFPSKWRSFSAVCLKWPRSFIVSSAIVSRFVRETVAESSIPEGGVAKVEWRTSKGVNTCWPRKLQGGGGGGGGGGGVWLKPYHLEREHLHWTW